jgi:hypothetical protein
VSIWSLQRSRIHPECTQYTRRVDSEQLGATSDSSDCRQPPVLLFNTVGRGDVSFVRSR